ncbi:MAG: hypothetical protein KF893_26245 [Caldilineaceae bacterium]|nr:hypothetical protein [Caldilineaceae bacterium]
MTQHKIDLTLTILLESPLHIGTGYGYAGYLDAVMITDAQGFPYIPGSSLKGRLRHYARQLTPLVTAPQMIEKSLFGDKEQTGALFFDNCALTKDWRDLLLPLLGDKTPSAAARSQLPALSQRQSNVMLSRLRGVALERRLFTVESAPAHLAFRGVIHGDLEDGGRLSNGYPSALCLLVAAIRACEHLGGRKSRGLGRCRLEIDSLRLNETLVDPDKLLEALA